VKGHPLSLSPMYVERDDHATGLVRLLSLALPTGCATRWTFGAQPVGRANPSFLQFALSLLLIVQASNSKDD